MGLALIVKTEDCVGCHACEVACKQEHQLPLGPRLLRVTDDGPQMIDGRPQLRYRLEYCQHCEAPACAANCPSDAIRQRADGIILIDAERCSGCGNCIEDCTFGAIQFDTKHNVALKCDMCVERIDLGRLPACAAACPSHCIYVTETADMSMFLESKRLFDNDSAR